MTKPPVRIHAGNNGVYDAVRHEDKQWRIWFTSWHSVCHEQGQSFEVSTTSYESAHEAMLAFERGPISYRSNEVA